jgi:hypothetical protein
VTIVEVWPDRTQRRRAPSCDLDPRGHTLDVIMLAVTGGRERTGNELGALLEAAGFADCTVIDTTGPLRIVEGVAA